MAFSSLDKINNLEAWENIYSSRESIEIETPDLSLSIFGNDEKNAYLVLEMYSSSTSCLQYQFIPDNPENRLNFLFDWLKNLDYDLSKLLSLINEIDYKEVEGKVSPEAIYKDMHISRNTISIIISGNEKRKKRSR